MIHVFLAALLVAAAPTPAPGHSMKSHHMVKSKHMQGHMMMHASPKPAATP